MSQAKERPILFSGHMVRAILNGQKTVTRREIKPSMRSADSSFELHQQEDKSWRPMHTFDESCMDAKGTEHPIVCPYGLPGDRLWVRETHKIATGKAGDSQACVRYEADGDYQAKVLPLPEAVGSRSFDRTRPSIHMPRWASRILLEVTDVRVELLQDISDEQCVDEGIGLTEHAVGVKLTKPLGESLPKAMFKDLWVSINGPAAWDANPWVWVVEFKMIV